MKNQKLRRKMSLLIVGILASLFIITGTLTANAKNNKDGKAERKAYYKENIYPVIQQQRKKLDDFLSPEEKAQVKNLQQRLATLKEGKKEHRKRLKALKSEGNKGERPELTEDQKAQHKAQMKEKRRIMMEAYKIADNHEEQIDALYQEIQPQKEQWKNDLQAMHKENRENREHKREKSEMQNDHKKRKGKFRKKKNGQRRGMNSWSNPARFILLDLQQDS
ncbi:hypothetical protein [Xanthovirga aplysinae]|uniref:hypothetical protein n=1 Tax=Xanthovirga aplysinae TaxID=2529853 RepID=UPI0012BBD3C1|nr:hypothetical protein [Xanthovirga aplysinae]MTI32841.1 hypothetical protein [Xanthovirga aplysinae]